MNLNEAGTIIDGKALAHAVRGGVAVAVERMRGEGKRPPGLAVVLVGDNPASEVYVRNKEKAAKKCGFETFNSRLPADVPVENVYAAIADYNNDDRVDGILLQLPLPKGMPEKQILDTIRADKDVDGLHPFNQGLLLRGEGTLRPCTPLGMLACIDLAYSGRAVSDHVDASGSFSLPEASLAGKHAVVVGRSLLVGKPASVLLQSRNATVTMAHSKTADLAGVCQQADILVAAVGVPELVKQDWVKPGAVVIDVGINRLEDGRLVGDVDFDGVKATCAAITPVPGGVGPLTVAMLLRNTCAASEQHQSKVRS